MFGKGGGSEKTWWVASNGKARCALEQLALAVFKVPRAHVQRHELFVSELPQVHALASYDQARSGVEWWVQVRQGSSQVRRVTRPCRCNSFTAGAEHRLSLGQRYAAALAPEIAAVLLRADEALVDELGINVHPQVSPPRHPRLLQPRHPRLLQPRQPLLLHAKTKRLHAALTLLADLHRDVPHA